MWGLFAVIDLFWFAAGFALCYFFREPVVRWYKGAEDYYGAMKDKAESILNSVKK
jgi:hypothetical protein